MRSSKYLDQVMEKHGLKNDRALAKYLGVGSNTVSQWRTGSRSMDHEMCLKVALALDMDNPWPVVMSADMDRAERSGQQSLWEVFSARMAKAAAPATLAIVAAGVTSFLTSSPVQAATRAMWQAGHFTLC